MIKLLHKLKAIFILSFSVIFFTTITGLVLISLGVMVALIALVKPTSEVGQYGFEVWFAFDRLWNAILSGDADETISSRLGKSIHYHHDNVFLFKRVDKLVSGWLDLVDENHCIKSINPKAGKPLYKETPSNIL